MSVLKNFILSLYFLTLCSLMIFHIPIKEHVVVFRHTDPQQQFAISNFGYATISDFNFVTSFNKAQYGILSYSYKDLDITTLIYFIFIITVGFLFLFFFLRVFKLV
jgi:hypothetical protein